MEPKSEEGVEPVSVGGAGAGAEPQLVCHPRAKSKVWKYFGFDLGEDEVGKRAHCRLCLAQIGYSGNTTNLYAHLQRHHPDAFVEFEKTAPDPPSSSAASTSTSSPAHGHGQQQAANQTAASGSGGGGGVAGGAGIIATGPGATALGVSSSSSARQISHDARRQAEVSAAVLSFLCEGLHPVATADEPFFQNLLRALDPRCVPPPACDLVSLGLPQRQQQARSAILSELAAATAGAGPLSGCVGVSADHWRSETHGRSYVTLYVHLMAVPLSPSCPAGLRPLSRCLKTFEVPPDSPSEGVTRALYEAFTEWGVAGRVRGATVGEWPDVRRACGQLELPVLLPCFAERLTLGVRAAFRLPGVASVLARCRRLVDYFQQSVVAAYMLAERLKQQGRPGGPALVGERPGCWFSSLTMLRRLRRHQPAVTSVLLDDANNQTLLLTAAEWTLLDGLLRLLQALRSAADMFSRRGGGPAGGSGSSGGSGGPAAVSMLKPVLHMLQTTALRPCEGDPADLRQARRAVAEALDEAYGRPAELDMFLKVASFLDPRYKRLPFLSAGERGLVEARVLEEATALYQRHAQLASDSSSSSGDDQPVCKKPSLDPPPLDSSSSDPHCGGGAGGGVAGGNPLAVIFCQSGSAADTQEEFAAQAEEELSNFKAQKVLGLNEDPLRWWSDRTLLFPMLPRVLQRYWCVPATSGPAHRLFGSAGRVLWGKRNRLEPEHVDQQVFLYENSRNFYEPEPSLGSTDAET